MATSPRSSASPSSSASSSSPAEPATTDDADRDAELSYENARAQLQEVLRALESGGQPLEESLTLWRRGEDLADVCQRWLDEASARLDEAIAARDDEPAT